MSFRVGRRFLLGCLTAVFLIGSFESPASAAARTAQDKKVDAAITRALKYLAAEQNASGGWSLSRWGRRGGRASTAATSLAIMSFMAAGHVPGEGPYGKQLNKAIDFMLDQAVPISRTRGRETVAFMAGGSGDREMYSHGISTLMLAEVCGMVGGRRGKRCRETLEKAIRLIVQAQNIPKGNRDAGGWRYSHNSRDSDLSVTGWQLLALRAAKDIGCDVPKDNIDRAVAYVKKCKSRWGGFGYQPGGSDTATRNGTGILCLEICGKHKSTEAISAADRLLQRPLRSHESHFYYGVYYCTVGMFKVGGKYWDATKKNTHALLLDNQSRDGSFSRVARGRRSRYGPVYGTAMCVLALAVEYRYLPIYQR